jgi:hypothetical protein
MTRKLSVSQIPALVGVWGLDAARQAWAEARGLIEPREETFRMRLGQEMTPVVLRLAQCPEEGTVHEHPVARSFAAGDLLGRIDAWIPSRRELWEAKTHARVTERALLAAYLQAQLYAALVGAERLVCAHLEFNTASLIVKDYAYSADVAERLLEAVEHLLEHWDEDDAVDAVQLYTPPPPAPLTVLSPEAAALAAIEELIAIREQRAELEARERVLRERVLQLLEDGEYRTGKHVVRIETRTRWIINTSALPAELRAQYGRETQYRTIVFVTQNGHSL